MTINLKGATEGALLKLDGKEAKPGLAVTLDPGLHKASASSNGETREKTFELAAGAQEVIELDFNLSQVSEPKGVEQPPKPAEGGPGIVPGVVVASIGGAAAIAGAIFGGIAVGKYDALEATCGDGTAVCPGDAGELDNANLFADVSTGLLIGGGVTLVTGVILMFALPGDAEVSQALIPGGFRF